MGTVDKHWDPIVLVSVIACLLIGWLVKAGVESRTIEFDDPEAGISLHYPASWLTSEEEDALLEVLDPLTPSIFNTKLVIASKEWNEDIEIGNFIVELTAKRGSSLPLYRTISLNPFQVNDLKAMKLEYAYAFDPIGVQAGVISVPIIVRAFDVILPYNGRVYIITLAAEEREYHRNLPSFHRILRSIQIQ